MEAMNQRVSQVARRDGRTESRGLFGEVSETTALVLAGVITLLTFGGIAYAINALFMLLG
ncbi:MAG: hypothetical protein RMK84_12820 [Oscillochloridaceae bacterium]|nr:hypothetical protein [Chloroflexaceae bacterium]MDW8391002.1 hypothetical protein [Oscillochloridaceae bacterium]